MEKIYTPDEVAEVLKIEIRTIYRYIHDGRLKAAKLGRVYRISETQLNEFFSTSSTHKQRPSEKDLEKIVSLIVKKYSPEKIILFGSLATGEKDPKDIDLLIVKNTDKKYFDRLMELVDICENTVPIDFLVYTPAELEDEINTNTFLRKEIIEKGKILYDKAA